MIAPGEAINLLKSFSLSLVRLCANFINNCDDGIAFLVADQADHLFIVLYERHNLPDALLLALIPIAGELEGRIEDFLDGSIGEVNHVSIALAHADGDASTVDDLVSAPGGHQRHPSGRDEVAGLELDDLPARRATLNDGTGVQSLDRVEHTTVTHAAEDIDVLAESAHAMIFAGKVHGRGLLPLILANIVEIHSLELIGELDRTLAPAHENIGVVVCAEGRKAARRGRVSHDCLDWSTRVDRRDAR